MTVPEAQAKESGKLLPPLAAFLRDFAAYAGRDGFVAGAFVAMGAVLEGLGLALIVPLLAVVTAAESSGGRLERTAAAVLAWFGVEGRFGRLALLIGLFGLLLVLRAIVIAIRDARVAALQTNFVESQRLHVIEALAAAPWDRVSGLRHARVTHIVSGDIQRIGAAASFSLRSLVSVVMLLAQCVLAVLLSPLLASFALVLLALSAIVVVPAIRRAHTVGGIVTNANLTLLNATAQFLGGLKLAVSQNLQASFVSEFRDTLHALTRRQIGLQRQQTNSRLAFSTLSSLGAGLLVLIGFGIFDVPAPTLIALLLVIARMSGPAMQIQQGLQSLATALPAYDAVKTLVKELAAAPASIPPAARKSAAPAGPIVFDAVTFRHADAPDRAPRGVESLNLVIGEGECVGIAGPSGAGKTTFADLLVGLYAPQAGRITVGSMPLEGATLAAWRDGLAYVSQDAFLFHDTVRRNLAWAAPGVSEAAMWSALGLAGAADLVHRMPEGLDTVVGERGTLVSGGERQRLALARALLRAPRLLVLDEATNAIDVAGERAIIERLHALLPRPTIVVIAHRAESLSGCDRVLRFEAGRCV